MQSVARQAAQSTYFVFSSYNKKTDERSSWNFALVKGGFYAVRDKV